ncbi:23554_t:CDS:1, partial [Gigaspora margarita]
SVIAKKEWGETTKRKLRIYFSIGKRKIVAKMSKRVHQLFTTRGEWYMYLIEHITIFILEKMYEENFTNHLLKEAQDQ